MEENEPSNVELLNEKRFQNIHFDFNYDKSENTNSHNSKSQSKNKSTNSIKNVKYDDMPDSVVNEKLNSNIKKDLNINQDCHIKLLNEKIISPKSELESNFNKSKSNNISIIESPQPKKKKSVSYNIPDNSNNHTKRNDVSHSRQPTYNQLQSANNSSLNQNDAESDSVSDNLYPVLRKNRSYLNKSLNSEDNAKAFALVKSRLNNVSKLEDNYESFMTLTIYDLQQKMLFYNKLLICFDLSIAILDLIVVTMLYFEHFNYIQKLEITEEGNIQRWICFGLSILASILIGIRFNFNRKYETLKYVLNYNSYLYNSNFSVTAIIVEIVFHLIQPYPNVEYHWNMNILGKGVVYNINMILFLISMLRLYTLIKTIKYWNYYSSEKSLRLLKFYKNSYINVFVYKVIIMVHSYVAILILFCAILYVASLIFKVVENYDPADVYYFGNFYNCIWYLISTMTGTGYGDYFPKTLIGRIVGVLCCIIGIFLLGLVVATLVILTQFNQDEKKVRKK